MINVVFDYLRDYTVGIVGSAAHDIDSAKDIDVLFPSLFELVDAARQFGATVNSWDAYNGRISRANVKLEGVEKPVQFVHAGATLSLEAHPYCVLLRDGTRLHDGQHYVKEPGWRYDKALKVDRRKQRMNRVIAIDFDGTIRDWDSSKPFAGAKAAINTLRERGYKVLIHSCNSPEWIKGWLNDYDIRYDYIWGESGSEGSKPIAVMYIDDRGWRFNGNWDLELPNILAELDEEAKPLDPLQRFVAGVHLDEEGEA